MASSHSRCPGALSLCDRWISPVLAGATPSLHPPDSVGGQDPSLPGFGAAQHQRDQAHQHTFPSTHAIAGGAAPTQEKRDGISCPIPCLSHSGRHQGDDEPKHPQGCLLRAGVPASRNRAMAKPAGLALPHVSDQLLDGIRDSARVASQHRPLWWVLGVDSQRAGSLDEASRALQHGLGRRDDRLHGSAPLHREVVDW